MLFRSKLVVCFDQSELRKWLCDRIGLVPTENIQVIGSIIGGRIRGTVGFDSYNGASLRMHNAGESGWLTRSLLKNSFEYAFDVCKVNVVLVEIASSNFGSIRFCAHLGFKIVAAIPGAHPEGALWIMSMERRECKYLNQGPHNEVATTATSS